MARGDGTSGYLQGGARYFPSDAPVWWSYTLNFATGGTRSNLGMIRTAGTAYKKLTGEHISEVRDAWSNPKVLSDIQALTAAARSAELAFLAKYGLGNPGDDWSELIRTFNLLFSSEAAFQQNLALLERTLKKHPKDKDNTYHYFVTHFASNVQTAARAIIRQQVNANMPIENFSKVLDDIIESALQRTFNQRVWKDSSGYLHTNTGTKEEREQMEIQQAYAAFNSYIKMFMENEYFKTSMQKLLGLDTNFIQDTYKNMKNRKKLPQVKDAYHRGGGNTKGTIAEAMEGVFAKAVGDMLSGEVSSGELTIDWQSVWSGGSGVKADIILHNLIFESKITNIDGLMSQSGEDDSKRANAISQYRDWFNKMKDARGDIIFISDKNYQINSDFKSHHGFTAQGKTTLANLLELLQTVGMGSSESLINFLANCGSDMLLGNQETEVLDAVATQIGHFLFDDLTITGNKNINRVHLLNLSGIYMPLSVYLDAICHALQEIQPDMKELVYVSFKAAPSASTAASPWKGKKDWEAFREARINKSYIHVKFMANFASFITSKVKV